MTMLDIKFIRENAALIAAAAKKIPNGSLSIFKANYRKYLKNK